MIFDTLENCERYYGMHKNFEKAFDFIKKAVAENLPAGRYDFGGEDIFAHVQEYNGKNPAEFKFEGHRKYIDIQYVVTGVEEINGLDIKNALTGEGYIPEREVEFFDGGENVWKYILGQGEYGIFYPNDLHKPGLMRDGKSTPVKKILVKVKI